MAVLLKSYSVTLKVTARRQNENWDDERHTSVIEQRYFVTMKNRNLLLKSDTL
jgi:hypothetical protein